jgi:hypothetical protein
MMTAYHDHNLLRPTIFDVLCQSLKRARFERLWRLIRVYYP